MKKNKEKDNRGLRSLIIVALIVSVAGISIVFAALSQTLQITTKGRIPTVDWNIKWVAASGTLAVGSEKTSKGSSVPSSLAFNPTDELKISGIILEKPGDKVYWIVKAENLGRIDAILSSTEDILDIKIDIHQEEESDIKEDDIIVTFTKNNNPTFSPLSIGDTLKAGATQEYILTVQYGNINYVPSHNVKITVTIDLPWEQK